MAITERTKVAEAILEHPETIEVFERYDIDYCCGGGATIEAAVAGRADVDAKALLAELERAIAGAAAQGAAAPPRPDPRALETVDLIARIVVDHHAYIRTVEPELRRIAEKVARVHGEHEPRLPRIERRLDALLETLVAHLDHEETVLFPALLSDEGEARETIEREFATMVAEHEEVGAALHEIRELADGYTVPAWGCPTYRSLYAKLRALEQDIHRHVHLENNVLMPRFAQAAAG